MPIVQRPRIDRFRPASGRIGASTIGQLHPIAHLPASAALISAVADFRAWRSDVRCDTGVTLAIGGVLGGSPAMLDLELHLTMYQTTIGLTA